MAGLRMGLAGIGDTWLVYGVEEGKGGAELSGQGSVEYRVSSAFPTRSFTMGPWMRETKEKRCTWEQRMVGIIRVT